MSKNVVREIFYEEATWTCPAGVTQVTVKRIPIIVPTIGSRGYGATFINQNGIPYSFGENNFGQLGDNTTTNRSSPVAPTTSVQGIFIRKTRLSGGCIADYNSGQLILWGFNDVGQLGNGGTNNISNAITPVSAASGLGFRYFDMSGAQNSMGIDRGGNLSACGQNLYGTVGDNTTTSRNVFTSVQPFGFNKKWQACAFAGYSAFAIDGSGVMYAWGLNADGQLGFGDSINRSTPTAIPSVSNIRFRAIAGEVPLTTDHGSVLAIDTQNNLWVWGYNGDGQLGLNDTINRSTPTLNPYFSRNVSQITVGHTTAYVSDTTGRLWSCGNGLFGSLGNNTTASVSSPVLVVGSSVWGSVANPVPQDEISFVVDVIPGQTYPVVVNTNSSVPLLFGQIKVPYTAGNAFSNSFYLSLEYEK